MEGHPHQTLRMHICTPLKSETAAGNMYGVGWSTINA